MHNQRTKRKIICHSVILVAMILSTSGCDYLYGRDSGYLAYKYKATDADIYLMVQDEMGTPIDGALIYGHIIIPDWPSQNSNPQQSYWEYKEKLISSAMGEARFKINKCISVIVYDVEKQGYTWIPPTGRHGRPRSAGFHYSKQAIATGDHIETSATDPYILRMKRVKENE